MANKENLPPLLPKPRCLSPSNRPALNRQRDHSECRQPDTPLRVRKTRENLKAPVYLDIPSPVCSHHPRPEVPTTDTCYEQHKHNNASDDVDVHGGRHARQAQHQAAANDQDRAAPLVQRRKSVSRRMLSRVKEGIRSRSQSTHDMRTLLPENGLLGRFAGKRKHTYEEDPPRAQSFEVSRDSIDSTLDIYASDDQNSYGTLQTDSGSTVSTAEVFGAGETLLPYPLDDHQSAVAEPKSSPQSLPSSQRTLRDLGIVGSDVRSRQDHDNLVVPHVVLKVTADLAQLDSTVEGGVWVAIEGVVHTRPVRPPSKAGPPVVDDLCGRISSLRLCFKPGPGCRLTEVLGERVAHNVAPGQGCILFIKLWVSPKLRKDAIEPCDHASLLSELESIVGTLETDLLHVEARYRNSLLPSDNIVTVRQNIRLRRPMIDSRWSLANHDATEDLSARYVHQAIASHIAQRYSRQEALHILDRLFGQDSGDVAAFQSALEEDISHEDDSPRVVVTDTDRAALPTEAVSNTAPHCLLPTAPVITSPLPIPMPISQQNDSARRLWQHIRRSSLSTQQLAALASPSHVEAIEREDGRLRELRKQALANKRSIGAETLRAWRWDDDKAAATAARSGEGVLTPWM